MVNPDEGTGSLSVDDAVESLMSVPEPEEANQEIEEEETPEPLEEDAPDPVESETEDADDAEDAEELDDEPEDETEEEQAEAPATYTVKVDGQEREVTLEELRAGFQMESDYRKKTAALADQQRETDQKASYYEAQLNQLVPVLERQAHGKWADKDWATLARDDPAEYVVQRQAFESEMQTLQRAKQEQQFLESQQTEKQRAELKERLAKESELLRKAMPEMADPDKAKVKQGELKSYLHSYDFGEQEVSRILDHRLLVLADKAMKWDRAQESVVTKKNAAKKAPKVQKPGTPRKVDPDAEKAKSARARLSRTGSPDDAVELLLSGQ